MSLHGDIRQIQLLLSADYNLDIIGCQLIPDEKLSSTDIFNAHETNVLQYNSHYKVAQISMLTIKSLYEKAEVLYR